MKELRHFTPDAIKRGSGSVAKTGIVRATISTGSVARDNAIIETGGWELDNYAKNPIVLLHHSDGDFPVAKTIELIKGDDSLRARAMLDMDDPKAQELARKIDGGFINATSVRWLPLETETRQVDGKETLVFVRQELLEWSFVSIPADPGALIERGITCEDGSCLPRDLLVAKSLVRKLQSSTGKTGRQSELELMALAGRLADALEGYERRQDEAIVAELVKKTGWTKERARAEAKRLGLIGKSAVPKPLRRTNRSRIANYETANGFIVVNGQTYRLAENAEAIEAGHDPKRPRPSVTAANKTSGGN